LSERLASSAEKWSDILRDLHLFLGAALQLVRFQLRQNVVQRQIHRGLVLIRRVNEYTVRRRLAQFTEGDADRSVGELGEDLLGRDRNMCATCRGLTDSGFKRVR